MLAFAITWLALDVGVTVIAWVASQSDDVLLLNGSVTKCSGLRRRVELSDAVIPHFDTATWRRF